MTQRVSRLAALSRPCTFLAVMTCAGQLNGWLRQVSGSVYPAVLAHCAFSMGLAYAVLCTTSTNPDAVAELGREAGIATLVVVAAAAVWVSTWRTTTTATTAPPVELVEAQPTGLYK